MEGKLLNIKEAATYLSVSKGLLYLWRNKGIGPRWIKLATDPMKRGCVRYRVDDLRSWLEKQERMTNVS